MATGSVEVNDVGFSVTDGGKSPIVDIVFVHGLRGHPKGTWTRKSGPAKPAAEARPQVRKKKCTWVRGVFGQNLRRESSAAVETDDFQPEAESHMLFWPAELLHKGVPNARILTFGYESNILNFLRGAANQNSIYQHGKNMLSGLEAIRRDCVLRRSKGAEYIPEFQPIYSSTVTVIFLGTPHRGANIADWESVAERLVAAVGFDMNDQLLRSLQVDSTELDLLREEFSKMLKSDTLRIHSFQEGKGLSGVPGFHGKASGFLTFSMSKRPPWVVEDSSSAIDDAGEVKEIINADHREMCRFAGEKDPGYAQVHRAIDLYVRRLKEEPKGLSDEQKECLKTLSFPELDRRQIGVADPQGGTFEWIREHRGFRDWIGKGSGIFWIIGKPGSGKSTLMKQILQTSMARNAHNSQHAVTVALRAPPNTSVTLKNWCSKRQTTQTSHYVQCKVRVIWGNSDPNGKDVKELEDQVIRKANGDFLWVELVVKELVSGMEGSDTVEELREKLSEIPSDLEGLFRRILSKVDGNKRQEARNMLQWVLFAERPLSITEFRYALTFGSSLRFPSQAAMCSSEAVVRDEKQMERRLISRCGGLLEVEKREDEKIVQPIHQSVKDFLLTNHGLTILELAKKFPSGILPDEEFAVLKATKSSDDILGEGHDYLAKSCITYLTISELGCLQGVGGRNNTAKAWTTNYPFLLYSVSNWMTHAAIAEKYRLDQTGNMELFGWPNKQSFEVWFQIHNTLAPDFGFSDPLWMEGTIPLHIASEYNMVLCLGNLLHKGDVVDAIGGRYGTALCAAAHSGHEGVVRLLLDGRANLEAKAEQPKLAQHPACKLREYMSHNGTKSEWTALHYAASRGHEGVVRLLLKMGADPKAPYKGGRTALHSAASRGHEGIVRLLLEMGADPKAQGKDGWTALHSAALKGHEGMVRLLLEMGADPKAQNKNGRTVLHSAASRGDEGVVRLLLEMGADPKAQDKDGWMALHFAVFRGDEGVASPLLEVGADPKAQDKNGWTVLHSAASGGHKGVVRLLLEMGADPKAQDKDGRTVLHLAAEGGDEGVVRLLLEMGADPKAQNKDGRTASHLAALRGHGVVARLLQG